MRKDMSKVIVERPRQGHENKYHYVRTRNHDDSEDAASSQSMKRPHQRYYGQKSLNENLNPLRRFIEKQVGRPWDKVYSEINEHVKVDNPVQAHVRQHLDGMLALKTMKDSLGRTWNVGRSWPMQLRKGDLYVDSKDGIIKIFKGQPKVKYDPGMKMYAIYRARKSHRPMPTLGGNWYYEVEYKLVERNKMAELGISEASVSYYFYAGTHTEAIKELDRSNGEARKHYWLDREYVPATNLKPKAKIQFVA